jgi:energy-coupling factor transporter ATP-binding protein EcfA2
MKNVMTEIIEWAVALPYWEQVALEKVISGEKITDSDYDKLLQYLLEDNQLAESTNGRPEPLLHQRISKDPAPSIPIRLNKITNLQNINALVTEQTLTFGPNLTAIFGANGSGKSGYARVLGSAGFTRGDKEVLPNINKSVEDEPVLKAEIEMSVGSRKKVVDYQVGKPCPQLASFYVFDSTSVHVHMCEQNPLSFSPAGLSYLKQLADVTDEVRARLNKKIEEYSQPSDLVNYFQGESQVSKLIADLGPETDLSELKKLASVTPEEQKLISQLNIEVANIELDKFNEQIDNLEQEIGEIKDFRDRLKDVVEFLNDHQIQTLNEEINTYHNRQQAAENFSVEQFESKYFSQTGTEVWHRFIHAAKSLADAEQPSDEPYPQPESHCLLCQQPLSAEARELILKLWSYLEGDAQAALENARQVLGNRFESISSLTLFDLEEDLSTPYKHIQKHSEKLFKDLVKLVDAYRLRRTLTLNGIDDKKVVQIVDLPKDCMEDLKDLIDRLTSQLSELKDKNLEEELEQLEIQKRELEHRVLLGKLLPQVENYVSKRIWAQVAGTIGGSTYHITRKHNQLFKQLVTKKYVQLFEQTLKDLGRPIRVKVETRGKKGQTLKQIVLEADKTASDIAKPEKVLSEGEKRAVALADFLTEVALDTCSNGIVLDDPVTSLDLEWRDTIAAILAEEAKRRQVIVFTHDLPFLYFLREYAEKNEVSTETHWIKRGDFDGRPGHVSVNNCPALERDYRKSTRARELYVQAKDASASVQEALLKEGFAALRTSCEAFIVFDLFNEVVMRFSERISFGRLKGICWEQEIADQVIEACERLSRCIEGHLHSDAFSATKPTLELLNEEIEKFDDLRNQLKQFKKQKL